jgi:archaellum component FlaC
MNDLASLPQPPQLEASYLALRTALDRLAVADQDRQLGGVASALNWSQGLLIAALFVLVVGLLIVAGLLQLGIIQPLKSLERSLASVGDGAVTQKVWGTERADEFGAIARAGERLRHSLTETTALKALADKGQLHISLDGGSSLLLQRLADEVTNTTNALKAAAADFAKLQEGNRRQFDTALENLTASTTGTNQAANALRQSATASLEEVRKGNADLKTSADERLQQLDRLAARYAKSHDDIGAMASEIRDQTTLVTENLSATALSLKQTVESVSQSYAQIAAGADTTSEKVRTLAARLSETIGQTDERLSRKLAALDTLEQTVSANMASLRAKAEEASAAMNTMAERQHTREDNDLKAAIAKLDQIAERLANPAAEPANAGQDLHALANGLQGQLETVRSEIRDLAIRMTEERLLSTSAASPLMGSDAATLSPIPQRSLADVPGEEIMARLKDLAAEMNAAQEHTDHTASLKSALGKFAADVKDLAASADRAARLKAMGRALDQHAEDIEAHMPAVEPATALRTELEAITGELRAIAASAQANGTKDGPRLRESAIEIGARAESLFSYLNQTHPDHGDEQADDEFGPAPGTTNDIAALAQLIDRMEARASSLAAQEADLNTNGAIHMVFESIGRLNNIATALARAGHAERQRHATH